MTWNRQLWGFQPVIPSPAPPITPLESLTLLTGLSPSLLILGDSLTPVVGAGPWTNSGAGVNVPAPGKGESLLSVAAFTFAQNTTQQIVAPNASVGDIDLTENMMLVCVFRTNNVGQFSLVGKRTAIAPLDGYELQVDGNRNLTGHITADSAVDIKTQYTVDDDLHHVGVLHFDVDANVMTIASEKRLVNTGRPRRSS